VLYLSGEGNARITSRIHAWIGYHRVTVDPDRFHLTNHVPDLMSDESTEVLARLIRDAEYDVVFIDTLGRAMAIGGGDISTPVDAAAALKNLQALSKYRPDTTPIAVHHPIKDGSMAGAYNLLAGVDVALFAEVPQGSSSGRLIFAKNKDGSRGDICEYQWRKHGSSAVLIPASGFSSAPGLPGPRGTVDVNPFDARRWDEERT
jgi:predicted ATP-dependent serine protease